MPVSVALSAPLSWVCGTLACSVFPGHLMGKKSTDELPPLYAADRDGLKEQLRGYIRWEEAARNLLGLLEATRNRSHQPPQDQPLGSLQPTWDPEDGSYFSDAQNAKVKQSGFR